MYEFLKMLQSVAERIGVVRDVRMLEGVEYFDDSVRIAGTTMGGGAFELKLTVGEKRESGDARN